MSNQIDLLIHTAEKFIGVKESPPGSNNVLFNTAYYGRAVSGDAYPWCMAFIWFVFREAGLSHLFFGGGKTASCTALMNFAKQNNSFFSNEFRRGDLALFNWYQNSNNSQHVGLITSVNSSAVSTIEGNTAIGNDSNGGQVMIRNRSLNLIAGVFRPIYQEDSSFMSQDDFNKLAHEYFHLIAQKQESDWSDKEGFWKKAVNRGLLDGSMPQSPVTREQLAAVLGRAGLI